MILGAAGVFPAGHDATPLELSLHDAIASKLIRDEPMNHLDVESIEAIEYAIDEYEGTVVL